MASRRLKASSSGISAAPAMRCGELLAVAPPRGAERHRQNVRRRRTERRRQAAAEIGQNRVLFATGIDRPEEEPGRIVDVLARGNRPPPAVEGGGVKLHGGVDLLEVAGAFGGPRPFPRLTERGQQHGGQDRYDGDHDKKFDQREMFSVHCSLPGWMVLVSHVIGTLSYSVARLIRREGSPRPA